ncbi:hypothetical protein WUBG_16905, partial [Wuchereria bancrofti]
EGKVLEVEKVREKRKENEKEREGGRKGKIVKKIIEDENNEECQIFTLFNSFMFLYKEEDFIYLIQ